MLPSHGRLYRFGSFALDAERLVLYRDTELVPNINKKSLQVLEALLRDANTLVTHDEIIERVWEDNPHGVLPNNVAQCIAELRRVLPKLGPGELEIETVRGRGYIFHAEVEQITPSPLLRSEPLGPPPSDIPSVLHASMPDGREGSPARRSGIKLLVGIAAAILLLLVVGAGWVMNAKGDDQEIRRVVKESQLFESLVLYKSPERFKESDLDRFWTQELDVDSNFDRRRIRDAVGKLVSDGRRYGDESKCEQFDFQSVDISSDGQTAVVKTLEKWFAAVYLNDGTLQKNRTIGPYFVSYILRKVDGRWLIEKSNTARANVSPPKINRIEPVGEIRAGGQFFVNISGEDFLPELVLIKVVGPGCPESNPCSVPNSALRDHAKISAIELTQVPLTLSSGTFTVYAHNGESQPSNRVNFVVP